MDRQKVSLPLKVEHKSNSAKSISITTIATYQSREIHNVAAIWFLNIQQISHKNLTNSQQQLICLQQRNPLINLATLSTFQSLL